jgi:hypothetical protein
MFWIYQMQPCFDAMRNQAEALSEDLMVVNAMKDFKRAYRALDAKAIPEAWLNSMYLFRGRDAPTRACQLDCSTASEQVRSIR